MAASIKFNGIEIEVRDGAEVVIEDSKIIVRPSSQAVPIPYSLYPVNPSGSAVETRRYPFWNTCSEWSTPT